jgi:hypothetical protein
MEKKTDFDHTAEFDRIVRNEAEFDRIVRKLGFVFDRERSASRPDCYVNSYRPNKRAVTSGKLDARDRAELLCWWECTSRVMYFNGYICVQREHMTSFDDKTPYQTQQLLKKLA